MHGSQGIIDLLFEELQMYCSQKFDWGRGKTAAPLLPIGESLGPMSNKIDVMKFLQSIMV